MNLLQKCGPVIENKALEYVSESIYNHDRLNVVFSSVVFHSDPRHKLLKDLIPFLFNGQVAFHIRRAACLFNIGHLNFLQPTGAVRD